MPPLLTTNAVITCPHGGVGTTIPSNPIFSVSGGYVCAEMDTGTLTCPFVVPCVGYTLKSMKLNATTVGGRQAILVTDFQQTLTGLPLSIVETNSAVDNSTPASLAPGETSAPLSPAMMDETPPVITAVPPVVPFSTMTMLPPTAVITFTLSHPYPLQWMLTLLNGTLLQNIDVTNGFPGLIVAPAGGSWSTPTMVVTATMTAAFMAALTPGTHYFYMTGVSQRGISAYAQATVVVS
jgi:hypothetical protein